MKSAEEYLENFDTSCPGGCAGQQDYIDLIRAVQRDALNDVATQLEVTAHNFNIEANDNIRKNINWEKRDEFRAAALIIRSLIPKEPT